jgi:hypothetical protein
MTTEVWFRNPHNYIRELAEVGVGRIAWDRGLLTKRRIDPLKHADAYFSGRPWRLLLMGEQGTAEYTNESGQTPVGVYPTWDASMDQIELLEEMMQYPIGDDADVCNDPNVPIDQRPVANQQHRVVVINLPEMRTAHGKAFVRKLKEMQEDYPDCVLHVHGLYSWRISFGMGFGATDVDPRTNAGKGKVTLPSGKEMIAEKTVAVPQWVTLLGMNPIDLTREPRNRCIYNIKSALWASDNYMENVAFAARQSTTKAVAAVDMESKKANPVETGTRSPFSTPVVAKPTDKLNCNTCSLQDKCKYYREGSVCSVPGSEPAELAKHFGTRDADQIIDGMGVILQLQARRLDRGVADENLYGELDPEVTKIANQIFTNGAKLAKLLDPARFSGPSVQVNVGGGGHAAIQAATPNQLLGSIIREMEARGIPRSEITPDMVKNFIAEMSGAQQAPKAIEAEVIARSDG